MKKNLLSRVLAYLAVFLICLAFFLPILFAFQRSIQKSEGSGWPEARGIPVGPGGLANYAVVLGNEDLPRYFRNSLLISGGTILGTIITVIPAAYAFSKMRFRGKELIYALFMIAILLPISSMVVPLFALIKNLKLINNPFGVIGPYIALGFPYFMLILRNFFDELPTELIEAARIDGCSHFRVLLEIILPLSKPALAVVVLFSFLNSWNEFLLAFLFLKKDIWHTVTLAPLKYTSQYSTQFNLVFATIILLAIPSILVFFILQRWYVRGLVAGAIKG